jgi:glutamine---fructose-6-phosphate transaminase (isomerizing)
LEEKGNSVQKSFIEASHSKMFREAAEAPECVAQQLQSNISVVREIAQRIASDEVRQIITCARGSSSHATVYGKYLLETLIGKTVSAFSPSTASIFDAEMDLRGALFLSVSQSGRSDDLLRSVEMAKKGGALTVSITNTANSPLSEMSEINLPLLAGYESSVAATKSFVCSLTALANIAFTAAGDNAGRFALEKIPDQLRDAWASDWELGLPRLLKTKSLFVTSRGCGFGIAKEAALKLKETSGLHAEALSSAELRHGPMAVVYKGFPILAFVPNDASKESVTELISSCSHNGADCIAIGAPVPGALNLDCPDATDPRLTPILQVQRFYRFANALSIMRGKNPDDPPFLKKVTVTV